MAQPARPEAGQETSLTVTISGFSPRDLHVQWYKGFSVFPSYHVTSSTIWIEEDSLNTVSSTMTFTPKRSDHNTSIRCEVKHSATKMVIDKQYNLCLAGDILGNVGIVCLTDSPRVAQEVTLRCNVAGCRAEDAMFSWYKGIFPMDGEIQNRDLEDGSGSFSTITFTPEESDRDSAIRCDVSYNYQTAEGTFTLRLQP